jgi:hypothetical protein
MVDMRERIHLGKQLFGFELVGWSVLLLGVSFLFVGMVEFDRVFG